MKYAIVRSGGKQYRCEEGATVQVDRLPVKVGDEHIFTDVLLLARDGDVQVGTPNVAGVRVAATVLDQIQGPKTIAFRYKAKERQRKKRGHRQQYTLLKVDKIGG